MAKQGSSVMPVMLNGSNRNLPRLVRDVLPAQVVSVSWCSWLLCRSGSYSYGRMPNNRLVRTPETAHHVF